MTRNDFEKWVQKNGTGEIERLSKNAIDWIFVTMTDNWVAIFEYNSNQGYVPKIQACNKGKAYEYVWRTEPINVPTEKL